MSTKFMNLMPTKQRWGFVVFRTDYSSDGDWIKFMDLYRTCPHRILQAYGAQKAALISSYEQMWWMQDRAEYENASIDTLRKHHRTWVAALNPQVRCRNYPEHWMFLVVDAEVITRVRETMDMVYEELPLEQRPFVKVFDAEASNESAGDGYPGWMKLRLSGLYYPYEKALESLGMRELCVKHTIWFDRDAHPEQTYYIESDESDSSTSDDEVGS